MEPILRAAADVVRLALTRDSMERAREVAGEAFVLRGGQIERQPGDDPVAFGGDVECRETVTCLFEDDVHVGEVCGPFHRLSIADGIIRADGSVIATLRGSYWQSAATHKAWPRVRIVEPAVHRPAILIAAAPSAADELKAALQGEGDCARANSHEEAVQWLARRSFEVILVSYYFDHGNPHRFINHARSQLGTGVPIVLVRALPIPLPPESERHLRSAYRAIGVDAFFNYREEADRFGADRAKQQLRHIVHAHLARGSPHK